MVVPGPLPQHLLVDEIPLRVEDEQGVVRHSADLVEDIQGPGESVGIVSDQGELGLVSEAVPVLRRLSVLPRQVSIHRVRGAGQNLEGKGEEENFAWRTSINCT